MSKDVVLKKIELKVSTNCCEGCKKKINKVLGSMEDHYGMAGVVKTDIDPFHPKVTVLGNLNPKDLIKKLQKAGKHAALSSYEELKEEKEDTTREKEKENANNDCDIRIEKTNKDTIEVVEDGKGDKDPDMSTITASNNQDLHHVKVYPNMNLYRHVKTHPRKFCYIAQPYYYVAASYPDDDEEESCHFQEPRFQPPLERPRVRAEDYFSDDNTMGCHVM
ncbi:uncharacterized protein [Arachis hypogaea]|uniref:uncharacterized protein isoform X1 n=1 Tax=Arachis hypogaea TaxID=3818 RepID=UPI000DECE5F7|nr:heavy metal-associated isoprenylated plant protein 35 isoform X1 [Arachis hypogaea]QHO47087.1 uncharacterized protein DS421_6g193310 [Arachis hypogaea]